MRIAGSAAAPALLLALPMSVAAAPQERCLVAEYRLPPSIAEEMRPYLLCGLISRGPFSAVNLNGVEVAITGGRLEGCSVVRSQAYEAAERRLAAAMRDPAERRAFLEAEFEKAERFLQTARRSEDLAVGEEASAPQCRSRDAQN